MTTYSLFATTPKMMENLLANELHELGAQSIKQTIAGVYFQGDLELAYRVCLWSRIANRVLLVLDKFSVHSQNDLYNGVQKINWLEHFEAESTFAVTLSAKNCPAINNTHFGALKVKDAIVDQFRSKLGLRPTIDTEKPDLRINVHIQGENAQLSLDLSSDSLHKRGYRDNTHNAPMKENLAAAMLFRAGWQKILQQKGTLLDPMCGSGTLLLEGAMIAADYAPNLLREYFGFLGWKKHDADLWQRCKKEAENRKNAGLTHLPMLVGFDKDLYSIKIAQMHAKNAGLQDKIHFERREIENARAAESWQKGLIICNPPYGERLGDENETAELYKKIGDLFKTHFQGWQAAIILSNPELGFRLGIRSTKPATLFNGALECKLLRFKIDESAFFIPKPRTLEERVESVSENSERAEMFANRLQKNVKKFSKWAKQKNIQCYRVYDADLPEYAVAVDIYQGEKTWVNVQEYQAPKSIDEQKANQRLAGILAEIPNVLNVDKNHIFLKVRRKQRHVEQYEKQAESGHFYEITEHDCRLLVNFEDYLDTGLFLDHRPIRLKIQQTAKGKRFLNLFAYTGSASVHAAVGGAISITSVDLSNTYIQWAKKNMALNKNNATHEFIQADCLEWLAIAAQQKQREYDLIFLDPPTFSNSKRMDDVFDIQRDHVELIQNATTLLSKNGVLYFSTNFRRFKLDETPLSHLNITDISAQTIPDDFARDMKIHYCFKIEK